MTDLPLLTLDRLARAVDGGCAAIRAVTILQPAGGAGDKVFPPTYAQDDKRALKYAVETRRIDGRVCTTVLLDSVASQANRMEQALLAGWREGALHFPVIAVDFSGEEGLKDLDRITTLDAPHRIADALLRDSVDEAGRAFRETPAGRQYTDARPANATAVYRTCPTALVFGVWDSTGPRGGLGNKFQRSLVSEIVGVDAEPGSKAASRIDPAGIQSNVDVFHARADHDDWTIEPAQAEQDTKGKPVPFNRSGAEGKGKPSAINHGNVAPTIDTLAGGVTLSHAVQTTVLSLPALRRLRFVDDVDGRPFDPERRPAAELAARTALAALAMAAVAWLRREGFDLRSRSLLVPRGALELELVPAEGGASERFRLDSATAAALCRAAHEEARARGMGWEREPVRLKPAPKLAALIRRSRALAAAGRGDLETDGGAG